VNKKIFLFSLVALALPVIAFAQDANNVTINSMMNAAEQTTLYFASGVVFILWVVTGLLFVQAQGDPAKLSKAKLALFAAVGGTLLVIIAASAIGLVANMFNVPVANSVP